MSCLEFKVKCALAILSHRLHFQVNLAVIISPQRWGMFVVPKPKLSTSSKLRQRMSQKTNYLSLVLSKLTLTVGWRLFSMLRMFTWFTSALKYFVLKQLETKYCLPLAIS